MLWPSPRRSAPLGREQENTERRPERRRWRVALEWRLSWFFSDTLIIDPLSISVCPHLALRFLSGLPGLARFLFRCFSSPVFIGTSCFPLFPSSPCCADHTISGDDKTKRRGKLAYKSKFTSSHELSYFSSCSVGNTTGPGGDRTSQKGECDEAKQLTWWWAGSREYACAGGFCIFYLCPALVLKAMEQY